MKGQDIVQLKFRDQISVLFWAIKFIFSIAPLENFIYIFLVILQTSIPSLQSYLAGRLIDQYTKLYGINQPIIQIIKENSELSNLLLFSVITIFLYAIIYSYRKYFDFKFTDQYRQKIENKFAFHVASLNLYHFDNHETASLIMKSRQNIGSLRGLFSKILYLVGQCANLIIVGTIVVKNSPVLAIIIFALSLPASITYTNYVKKWWAIRNSRFDESKILDSHVSSLTAPVSITQVRILDQLRDFIKRIEELSDRIGKFGFMTVRKWKLKFDVFLSGFEIAQQIGIPLLFLNQLIQSQITIGSFVFLVDRSNSFATTLKSVFGEFSEMFDQIVGASEVKKLFELENNIINGETKLNQNSKLDIEFKNVWFKYPGTSRYIFENLNIQIHRNEEIALVGINGAGKSTFIKLLLRMYEPEKGQILIDGKNIKEYQLSSYYRQISVLLQDYILYPYLTIKENILVGNKIKSQKALQKVLKLSEAESVIKQSPLGLNQKLDRKFRDGMHYSSGQKQKIAIARLLYRNSSMLILDEPTASIDPVSEYKIFKRIYKFMTNKTVIIISHRFSTVRNAQKIYVLDNGKIVEQGSHFELVKLNGKYANAFNKQAEGYNKEA